MADRSAPLCGTPFIWRTPRGASSVPTSNSRYKYSECAPGQDTVKWSSINWGVPSPCLQRPWDRVCLTDNQRSAFYVPKFKVKPERGHSKTTWTIFSVIYTWTFFNKNVDKNWPGRLWMANYLVPTHSFPRSFWMPPKGWFFQRVPGWNAGRLLQ